MFSFFKKKKSPPEENLAKQVDVSDHSTPTTTPAQIQPATNLAKVSWLGKLKGGLQKTSRGISSLFAGSQIDEQLYQELEDALLMADSGVTATEQILTELKLRVKQHKSTEPQQVKLLLIEIITELLQPLEKTLAIGDKPTVLMVVGVNGAGKTTSIGKLTKHLADAKASILLAAADTFRAAAKEQLNIWADRNTVEIISQEGADPAAVSFDAIKAGIARHKDVVIIDTAGRLPTQQHLMEELKKINRVIGKAMPSAPHEVLLVIDGNTGQNMLNQVKLFNAAVNLTGLIVTKLDGTAKGGAILAIANECQVPIYFIGVGEAINDLQPFRSQDFANAIIN